MKTDNDTDTSNVKDTKHNIAKSCLYIDSYHNDASGLLVNLTGIGSEGASSENPVILS